MKNKIHSLNPPTTLGAAPLLDRCFIQLSPESGVVLSLAVRLSDEAFLNITENLQTYGEDQGCQNHLKTLLEELSHKLCEQIRPVIDRMTRDACFYSIKRYELVRSN